MLTAMKRNEIIGKKSIETLIEKKMECDVAIQGIEEAFAAGQVTMREATKRIREIREEFRKWMEIADLSP